MATEHGSEGQRNDSSSECTKRESHVAAIKMNSVSMDLDAAGTGDAERKSGDSVVEVGARNNKTSPEEKAHIKLYTMRFWTLLLFVLCTMLSGMQWAQHAVIADVTMCFYGVNIQAVYWTVNMYFVVYPLLVFPVSWIIGRLGLRKTLLIGAFCNLISTVIQCISLTPTGFAYVLVSQAIGAISQVFILPVPPLLAAMWFGENEVSRACAIGVFGNQFGGALGFVFTPLVVTQDCTKISTIAYQKGIVAYTLVGCNAAVFLMTAGTLKDRPNTPPSLAQVQKADVTLNFKETILKLVRNSQFDLLCIMYGLVCGVFLSMTALLNPLILPYFPGRDKEIGWMGLIAIIMGCIGSVIAGYVLDWTRKYKLTSTGIFVLSFLSMIAFTALLRINLLWVQFVTIALLGFFLTSYFPVGLDFGAEITYPEPESISGSILNASTMIFGLVITLIGSTLLEYYGDLVTNIFLCALVLVGCLISVFIKCDYRRRDQGGDSSPGHGQTRL